jgi:hypothetical protein
MAICALMCMAFIMADYTGIVEAGEALVELLREELTPEPIGSRELISLCSPHESDNNQLTVYLYWLEEDPNESRSGYYQHSRDIQKPHPARINLSYLITAHSKAPAQIKQADQYRMIGAVIQAVKDNSILDRKYYNGSILETEEELRISVERLDFDQLIKIWNNTSSPYQLSVSVKVEGLEISSKRERPIRRVGEAIFDVFEKTEV